MPVYGSLTDVFNKPTQSLTAPDVPEIEEYFRHYPADLKLSPRSPDHTKLRDMVLRRVEDSYSFVSQRFSAWNEVDNALTAYIPLSEVEERIKGDDSRKPVSIVVPVLAGVLDVFLTQFIRVFSQEPLFHYVGHELEDMYGAALLEKVIELHTIKTGVGLALHTMWRDMFAYGFGAVSPVWLTHRGNKVTRNWLGIKRNQTDVVTFEGNKLENVSPYCYFPDPSMPIDRVHDGEFVAWITRTTRQALLREEKTSPDIYFNCKYLKYIDGRSRYAQEMRGSEDKIRSGDDYVIDSNTVDVINFYADLIPKELKLGDSEYPEKWLIGLAGDELIVRAQPLNLNHGEFPVAVAAANYDGRVGLPVGHLEQVYGMQEVVNFLFNSHIENVRRAVNLGFVVDPMSVNIGDMLKPKAAMLIRTHPSRWGRGVKDVVEQLKISDITRANIGDISAVIDLIERTTGASSAAHGLMRTGSERRSATEAHDVFQSAMGRILHAAYIVAMQAHLTIADMFAHNTQQLMSEKVFVETVGDFADRLAEEYPRVRAQERLGIKKEDVLVNYNVKPRDNSMQMQSTVQDKINLFDIILRQPGLAAEFDTVKLFKSIAKDMGFRNVEEFTKNKGVRATLTPMEEIQRQVQAGNMLPVGAMGE